MQGRVKPTLQAQGVAINNDRALEQEADLMGVKKTSAIQPAPLASNLKPKKSVIQRNGDDKPNINIAIQDIEIEESYSTIGHKFSCVISGRNQLPKQFELDWGESSNIPYINGYPTASRTNMYSVLPNTEVFKAWNEARRLEEWTDVNQKYQDGSLQMVSADKAWKVVCTDRPAIEMYMPREAPDRFTEKAQEIEKGYQKADKNGRKTLDDELLKLHWQPLRDNKWVKTRNLYFNIRVTSLSDKSITKSVNAMQQLMSIEDVVQENEPKKKWFFSIPVSDEDALN
jgi:hypothetical protein